MLNLVVAPADGADTKTPAMLQGSRRNFRVRPPPGATLARETLLALTPKRNPLNPEGAPARVAFAGPGGVVEDETSSDGVAPPPASVSGGRMILSSGRRPDGGVTTAGPWRKVAGDPTGLAS
jgi:hypothetical protein